MSGIIFGSRLMYLIQKHLYTCTRTLWTNSSFERLRAPEQGHFIEDFAKTRLFRNKAVGRRIFAVRTCC
jgi:hypothetical protein